MAKDKEIQKIEWFSFAESYLSIARLTCEEIIEPKHKKNYCNEESDELSKQNFVTYYIPIIYNLRHGIELFIKGILVSLNIDFRIEIKRRDWHNIKKLFMLLEKKKNKINQLFEMEEYTKLSDMVNKYKKFIDWRDEDSNRVDKKNMLARHPDNEEIDYFDIIYGINNKAIESIHGIEEDIRTLNSVYFNIKNFLFSIK